MDVSAIGATCVPSASWGSLPVGLRRLANGGHAQGRLPHGLSGSDCAKRGHCGNREEGSGVGSRGGADGAGGVGGCVRRVCAGAVRPTRGLDETWTVSRFSGPCRAQASSSSGNGLLADTAQTFSTEEVLPRQAHVSRVTKETSVDVHLNLDGSGISSCDTGIPFLDHMLDQLASHGLVDVKVIAKGDIHIDDHHTNEDVGLAVGTALLQALGDRKGIYRFGDFSAPLDEALVHVVLDLSGRPFLGYDLNIPTQRVGTYDTQLVEHFFQSMVNTSGMTLHIRQLAGKNSHHIIEATFKAFARALRQAMEYDTRRKGTIPRLLITILLASGCSK